MFCCDPTELYTYTYKSTIRSTTQNIIYCDYPWICISGNPTSYWELPLWIVKLFERKCLWRITKCYSVIINPPATLYNHLFSTFSKSQKKHFLNLIFICLTHYSINTKAIWIKKPLEVIKEDLYRVEESDFSQATSNAGANGEPPRLPHYLLGMWLLCCLGRPEQKRLEEKTI